MGINYFSYLIVKIKAVTISQNFYSKSIYFQSVINFKDFLGEHLDILTYISSTVAKE